ncbi:MAG TPA: hypothetical protein VNN08_02160 [Thermoanaerobaculia bacterium]|nr:hypothetical protein [Thermoanaerobaculia bacterium]
MRLLVALILSFAALDEAWACSCGRKLTVTEASSAAAYVVTGVVRGVHPAVVTRARLREPADVRVPLMWPVSIVEVAVTRSFTRPAPQTIELTHMGCCVCEAQLEVGREYLLFIMHSDEIRDGYMVSICYPNRRIESAASSLKELPPGTAYNVNKHSSWLDGVRWRSDGFGNMLARIYARRFGGYPSVRDPLELFHESPWLSFAGWVALSVVVASSVVLVLRKFRA